MLLHELEAEYSATKKCIERVPENLYGFKPHPTAMAMNYLVSLVAEIPLWISLTAERGEIDLGTYPYVEKKRTAEMVNHFERNFKGAQQALKNISDEDLKKSFSLKRDGKLLQETSKLESIASSLNHWVHHRGQLTVYMRMNDIKIPSIYGPSADEKVF